MIKIILFVLYLLTMLFFYLKMDKEENNINSFIIIIIMLLNSIILSIIILVNYETIMNSSVVKYIINYIIQVSNRKNTVLSNQLDQLESMNTKQPVKAGGASIDDFLTENDDNMSIKSDDSYYNMNYN